MYKLTAKAFHSTSRYTHSFINISDAGLDLPAEPSMHDDDATWAAWRRATTKVIKQFLFDTFGIKASFSARRLCSCGCSPAFFFAKDDTTDFPRRGFVFNVVKQESYTLVDHLETVTA